MEIFAYSILSGLVIFLALICFLLQKKVYSFGQENAVLNSRLEGMAKETEIREEQKKTFRNEFEVLANKLLEEKGKKFTDANKELLAPLKEQLGEFRKRMEHVHEKSVETNASLLTKIGEVQNLNQQLSTDAKQLTTALSGGSQNIGAWGEMILEKILESSGLVKGREYETQTSFRDDDQKLLRPDAIIHLPRERDVVIDSKLSLIYYNKSMGAEDIVERNRFLKEHADAMRKHVKDLSGKYNNIAEIRTLDSTLMFVPIEGALVEALKIHKDLQDEAFTKGIILASPSTLMVALKSVHHIWSTERREHNIEELSKEVIAFLDKLSNFSASLEEVGSALGKAKLSYETAHKRLISGNGSVARRAEKIKELGSFYTKKELPSH